MSHFEVWCLLEAGAYCDLRVNSAALILGKVLIRGNTVYILEWYMILLKKLFVKNNCLIVQLSKISLCCKKIMWKLASDFMEYANETFEI